MSSIGGLAYIW